jgi:hypothetical protein
VAKEPCSLEQSSTLKEKGVVIMKILFTSLEGAQLLLQAGTLAVSFLIFSNTIVEEPVKEIQSFLD